CALPISRPATGPQRLHPAPDLSGLPVLDQSCWSLFSPAVVSCFILGMLTVYKSFYIKTNSTSDRINPTKGNPERPSGRAVQREQSGLKPDERGQSAGCLAAPV